MSVRGQYAKGAATREQILDVALELVARSGYDKVSFREIARRAGLSQAGLLHHFKTKQDLFVAVIQRRDEEDQEGFDWQYDHRLTPEGLISAVEHNAERRDLVRLYVSLSAEGADQDGTARRFFAARYQGLMRGIADDIRRRQDAGEISTGLDPIAAASLLIAAADGLQVQWLVDPGAVDMGRRLSGLWDHLRGLD